MAWIWRSYAGVRVMVMVGHKGSVPSCRGLKSWTPGMQLRRMGPALCKVVVASGRLPGGGELPAFS